MVFLTSSLNLSLTALCLAKKAKADRVVVLCKSVATGHSRSKARHRLSDKLEFLDWDPSIQKEVLYKEEKKAEAVKPSGQQMSFLMPRALARLVLGHHRHRVVISDQTISSTTSSFTQTLSCSTNSTPPYLVEVLSQVIAQLSAASVPEPELSAKYLLSCTLSQPLTPVLAGDWAKSPATHLTPEQVTTLARLVQCRLARMPVQYILGNWDFHNITILVRPPVFIPRPETEQLVELVLSSLPPPVPGKHLHLLEVGPGSGAVSLAILSARQDLQVTCVERSMAALQLTKDNATMLGLEDRVNLVKGKVEAGTQLEGVGKQYDLVFSNPPYILRKDLMALAPEISLYEDLRALDGGAEGLDVILPILEMAGEKLPSGGLVILEVDPCHPHILPTKLDSLATSFVVDRVVEDFMEKERFMVLRKT